MRSAKIVGLLMAAVFCLTFSCHKKPDITPGYEENFHCVMTATEPLDMELYKSLMPNHPDFSMPDRPLVGFYAFYVFIPKLSFIEGGITLRVKYKGKEGWTMIFNTVEKSENLIYYGARMSGFPKFKVDDIPFEKSGEDWKASLIKDGQSWLTLNFTPAEIPSELPDWQRRFMNGEEYLISDPLFLLVPPGKGPYAHEYDTSVLAGQGNRTFAKGMVTVSTDLDKEWAGLIPSEPTPGLFFVDGK